MAIAPARKAILLEETEVRREERPSGRPLDRGQQEGGDRRATDVPGSRLVERLGDGARHRLSVQGDVGRRGLHDERRLRSAEHAGGPVDVCDLSRALGAGAGGGAPSCAVKKPGISSVP